MGGVRGGWIAGLGGIAGAGCLLANPAFDRDGGDGGATGGESIGSISISISATGTTGAEATTGGATTGDGASGSGGATTGGATTGIVEASSGGTTELVGGTSTTGAEPGCMNNVIEAGEACDDGNAIDDDACTNLCHLRPTGVAFDPAVRGQIFGVQNVVGAWKKSDFCPPGQALVGLQGANRVDLNVWEIVGRCGSLTIPAGGVPVVEVAGAQLLDPHGAGGMNAWSSDCPADQIVVGMSVRADGLGLYQVAVHCAPLLIAETADGFVVKAGTAAKLPLQPMQAAKGQLAETPCDAAVGTYVHDLEVPGNIGALALQCATYTLTP